MAASQVTGACMDRREALSRLQDEELDILLMFRDFCAERGLVWFLESGSCLGAIRHQGFIPWDDDVDVGMLRPDYERFLELAEDGLPEGYSLHVYRNTDGYAAMFAKIYRDGTVFRTRETTEAGCAQGIFIDIFPYDALLPAGDARNRQCRNAQLWKAVSFLYHAPSITVPDRGLKGAVERLACRVAHRLVRALFRRDDIARRWERSINNGSGNPRASEWALLMGQRVRAFSYDDLFPTRLVPFAGHQLPVPRDTNGYLERLYGAWGRLPDPEDRKTHLPLEIVFSDGSAWES